jgi:hypothetical protein
MRKTTLRLFVLVSLLGVLLSACTPPVTSVEPASNTAAVATATTLPTATPLPPTATATATYTVTPTVSATATSTHTPSATPTATATATATLLPTATNTPLPPTATPVLYTATPWPTATSSLPGNPITLTGGSYNGCFLLAPGQYTTAPNCSDCVRMDLMNWILGSSAPFQQVIDAYVQDGMTHVIFASGEEVNLHAANYLFVRTINSLSRAIETKGDSIEEPVAVSPEEFLSILGDGTWVGYYNFPDQNHLALGIAAVCGE